MLLDEGAESAVISGNLAIENYAKVKQSIDLFKLITSKVEPVSILSNYWFYGKTGTGKSLEARKRFPDHFAKDPDSIWFTGYSGQKTIIIDDFEPVNKKQSGLLKRLADHYPAVVRVHGLQVIIRPVHVVVTSNFHPSEIWDEPYLSALLRRFTLERFLSLESSRPILRLRPTTRSLSRERSVHSEHINSSSIPAIPK